MMTPEQLHALKDWIEKQCTFMIERRLGMPIDRELMQQAMEYERRFDEIMLADAASPDPSIASQGKDRNGGEG